MVFAVIMAINGCSGESGVVVLSEQELAELLQEQSSGSQQNPSEVESSSEPDPMLAVAPENPTIADITDLILITGQSNALGSGTAYDSSLDSSNKRVFAFTEDGWQVADLHQVWDLGWFPRTNPGSEPSNNFSLHFGKQLAMRDQSRVVGFILVTAPGQSISHWQSDGAFFNEIRDKVSNAINQLPSKSSLDGILWHQGESDGRDDASYSDALYQLIADFRSESWYEYGRPFVCGETADSPVNRQLEKLNRDNDPWTACIAAEDLPTLADGAHFSAKALRIMGDRYADKYLEMTR